NIHSYDDVLLARARAYNLVPVTGALWSLGLAATEWRQVVELAAENGVVLLHPELRVAGFEPAEGEAARPQNRRSWGS
ncbi:MAG: hypothetical protein ACRDNL_14540, partial [Spirillospora sp.]